MKEIILAFSLFSYNIYYIVLEDDVRQAFKKFGTILDIRHFKAQGYSFVRFDNKDSATKSITDMNGAEFMGQSIRCSWGKTDVILFYFY